MKKVKPAETLNTSQSGLPTEASTAAGRHMASASVASSIPMTRRMGRISPMGAPPFAGATLQTFVSWPEAGLPIMARNSRRVAGSARKPPSMRLVTMVTPGLWMPRVVMH